MDDIANSIDYLDFKQISGGNIYIAEMYQPSGMPSHRVAEPVNTPQHSIMLSIPDQDITQTIPRKAYNLSEEESDALWMAARKSTKLISKGRVIK